MRFAPGNRLLFLTAVVAVPAMTLVVYDFPTWAVPCLLALASLVGAAVLDLQRTSGHLDRVKLLATDRVRATAGRTLELAFDLSCPDRLATSPLRFGLPVGAAFHAPRGTVLEMPAAYGEPPQRRLLFPLIPLRRGQFAFSEAHLETSSGWGFWLLRRRFPLALECRVYPDLRQERQQVAALFMNRGQLGAHAVRQVGKGREFEKLREYQPGDDYGDIDWKASARKRFPVTRTYQIERTQEIYVILDHSRFSGREIRLPASKVPGEEAAPLESQGGEHLVTTQLERFLHCALILAAVAEKQGDRFGMITFADRVGRFLRARNGREHYDVVRDAVYTLEPRPVSPDFEQLMIELRQRLTRRALLVMLVDLSDPLTAEQFLQSLPLISRQHLILVNMVRPAGAFPLFGATPPPVSLGEVYGALGGHFQWSELRATARKLKHLGVEMGLPDQEELTAEVVTQYLTVKRRQLL